VRFYAGFLGIAGFFLAGIQIWILAFCLLMQAYLLPLVFVRGWGIRRAIKWSAILVVLRPGLSVLLFIQASALFALLTLTGIGLVFLAYSLVSLFLCTALRETLRDLEARWSPSAAWGPRAPGARPASWKEIFAEDDQAAEEEDEEEKRTLKNIFRPWDG
jgi:hypothetical protein